MEAPTDRNHVHRGLCGLHGTGGLESNAVRKVPAKYGKATYIGRRRICRVPSLYSQKPVSIIHTVVDRRYNHRLRSTRSEVYGCYYRRNLVLAPSQMRYRAKFFSVAWSLASLQRSRGLATIVTEQGENSQRRKRRADLDIECDVSFTAMQMGLQRKASVSSQAVPF